jgi:hypothetical protein
VDFLPTGQDNSSYAWAEVSLSDGQQLVIPDVLDTLFSATGTGALRIVATGGTVIATAAETKEPSGAWVHRHAAIRSDDDRIGAGQLATIVHLSETAERRTDLGVVNTSGVTIDVTIELRDAAGTALGLRRIELLPYGHAELDAVFSSVGHPEVADGLARLSSSVQGGSFLAHAVVAHLATQDSWEMPAELASPGVFADAFESGDTSAWDQSAPEHGRGLAPLVDPPRPTAD